MTIKEGCEKSFVQRAWLCAGWELVFRLPETDAQFINKS